MAGGNVSRKILIRVLVALVMLGLIAAVVYVIFATPLGERFREDPRKLRGEFREWVHGHRIIAPAVFILVYVVVSLCFIPVWWLGLLAGFGFGLAFGMIWSVIGAVAGACCCFWVSRMLLAEYFQRKFEARHAKLRDLDEKMGHNGLLIVMAARLMHFLPFGPSNYLFGITRIKSIEVTIGTLLGSIPSISIWVLIGAGVRVRGNWWVMGAIGLVNVLLLVPILLRYLKPQWFKKIGVE
jgi:uncharacterized membrane protein YdjX (TVP38/TMEM64 family)